MAYSNHDVVAYDPVGAAPMTADAHTGDDPLEGQTEQRLAVIWSAVLRTPSVGPHDNFFDLGGYSLLTARLLRSIQEVFGVKLSVAALFQAKDLRAMAQLIEQGSGGASRQIVLQSGDARPPIYWFDVGPQIRRLARALGPDQPFVGINLLPDDEERLMRGRFTVEALADALVGALRAAQLHGPYYLGGWCRWGVIAYAAAVQLERAGEDVKLLTLLDSVNVHGETWSTTALRKRMRRWVERRMVLFRRDGLETYFGQKVETAALRYRPPTYHGDVAVFRAADADVGDPADGGWGAVVKGRLTVATLPGNHRGILKPPHVFGLAARLQACMAEAALG